MTTAEQEHKVPKLSKIVILVFSNLPHRGLQVSRYFSLFVIQNLFLNLFYSWKTDRLQDIKLENTSIIILFDIIFSIQNLIIILVCYFTDRKMIGDTIRTDHQGTSMIIDFLPIMPISHFIVFVRTIFFSIRYWLSGNILITKQTNSFLKNEGIRTFCYFNADSRLAIVVTPYQNRLEWKIIRINVS